MKINFDGIVSAPVGWILDGRDHQVDDYSYKRLRFLCFAFVLAFLYSSSLLVADTHRDSNLALGLDLVMIGSVLVLAAIIRWTSVYNLVFHASIIILTAVIVVGYFAPTGNRTVFLAPTVLILAYFLLGRLGGFLWTILLFLSNALAYEIGKQGIAFLPISGQTIGYSSLSIGIISILLFIYEGVNVSNERRIAERDQSLHDVNAKLSQELSVSNELKEELNVEKQSVEREVELRTQQLQEEEARLQASIATLELGFLMTLEDGTVITYNPALLRICELENQISKQSLLPLLTQKVSGSYNLQNAISKCLADGRPFEATDVVINDNKYIRILGSAIHSKDNSRALGVVLLIEDMTAAKALERSENEFVAIASHELRTPLTIIRGNLSLLDDIYGDKFTDKGLQDLMKATNDASSRMLSIINQFLTMARLEQKNHKFVFSTIDVTQVVNTTLGSLKPLIDAKKLALKVGIPANLPKVKADPGRLQEILANLVSNAIKHTFEGYIEVSATAGKDHVTIRVSDTGKGIAGKNQKLLFHKFQQASDNIFTRDDSRSIGLGLYISKLLVEQMGGTIELEHSELGKGTAFSFSIPVAKND